MSRSSSLKRTSCRGLNRREYREVAEIKSLIQRCSAGGTCVRQHCDVAIGCTVARLLCCCCSCCYL